MSPFQRYNYFKLTIFNENIENVFKNINAYLSGNDNNLKTEINCKLQFELISNKAELDYNGKFKFLLFEPLTNPNSTVFFTNLIDGWYTLVYNYSRLFNTETYQIGLTINENEKFPSYSFNKFFYNKEGVFQHRIVQLIN